MVVRIRVTRMTLVALVCLLAQLLALPLPATTAEAASRGSSAANVPTATAPAQPSGSVVRHPYPRASLLGTDGTPLPTDVPTPVPSVALTATTTITAAPATATAVPPATPLLTATTPAPSDTPVTATAVPAGTPVPSDSPTPSSTPLPSPSSLDATLLGAPLYFTPNAGQTDPSVAFLTQGPNYTLFLSATGATLASIEPTADATATTGLVDPAASAPPITQTQEDVLKIQYAGASSTATMVGQNALTGTVNYLQGSDPSAWLSNVATYGQVAVQGVYPGIDLVYYGSQGRLEYDWQVSAGADPGAIALTIQGAQGLRLDAAGALLIGTANGTLEEQIPVAYQESGGQRQPVTVQYVLRGDGSVGLRVGAYDPSQPLVIDPVLSYSTYLGGGARDSARGIAVDAAGNAYVTGFTASTNFPTTTGAYTTTYQGGSYDAFVTKLDASGSKLVYSTYLGGSSDDYGHGIAVDSNGDAYVVGYTYSSDFPTSTTSFQPHKPNGLGYTAMFLSELNPSGSGLVYSTYYAGSKSDYGYGVTVDPNGNAYLVGAANSGNNLSTLDAAQSTNYGTGSANTNAVWAEFGPTGQLLYGTYIGGSGVGTHGDYGYGIALDPARNVYITGGAGSADFPYAQTAPKSGCPLTSHVNSNTNNIFVAKYSAATHQPVYIAYIGGGNNDFGYAVAADAAGNAYLTGRTTAASFPVTHSYQNHNKGATNAFVAAVNYGPDGCVDLLSATFLGGSGSDDGYGLTLDNADNVSIAGDTTSPDFPTTPDALQGAFNTSGPSHAFVSRLDPTLTQLTYSTLLEGSGGDYGTALAQDSGGSLYATGDTTSTDFITTTGAYSTSYAGGIDSFVTKLGGPHSGTVPWHAHHSISLGAGLDLSLDLSDGHVDLHTQGMDLPARGLDLAVGTTWDSALAQQGAASGAGTGWVSDLTPRISGVVTGTLFYTDTTGTVWGFLYTGSVTATLPYSAYTTPAGLPWALTATTSGYSLTNILTSEVLNFDTTGRYLSDVDAYGNATTLSYNSSGGVTALTNSGGRALTLYPDASGRLLDIQSPLLIASGAQQGQQVAYSYNGAGQLQALIRGYGTADAVTSTFGYSGTQLVTVTTPLNQSWLLGYDSAGRISYVASPVSGTVGQAGYTPSAVTVVGYAPNQTILAQGYNTAGQLATIYTLDGAGEPIITTDGLGHSRVTFYDADHDPVYQQDANGHATTNYYQYVGPNASTGLVTETVAPAIAAWVPGNQTLTPVQTFHYYNATNDLTETVSPEGGATLYTYDGHHSISSTVQQVQPLDCQPNPCSAQWQGSVTSHDQYGELTASTDGRGVNVTSSGVASLAGTASPYTRHTTYDTQGDVQAEGTAPITTTLNGQTHASTPVTTTYGYDADGNQTSLVSANGNTTTYSYDHLGRQTQVSEPRITLYDNTAITPTQTTRYDGDDRAIQQVDGNGDVTSSSFDPLGRQVAATNPVSGTTVYTYAATEQTAVQDPMGNVTASQYDAAGRLTQQTDPVSGTVQYQYDPANNPLTITTGTAGSAVQIETRGYDALNRVVTDTLSGPSQPPTTTLTAYNLDGAVAQVRNPNGDVVYNTYDAAGRLLTTETDPAPVTPGTLNPAKYDSYTYDPAGNATLHVDADGRTSTTQYDGDNRVLQSVDATSAPTGTTTITTTPGYDSNGTILSQTTQTSDTTNPGVVATHTYTATVNAADWTTSSSDDGLVTAYGYDAAGQQRTETVIDGQTPVTSVLDPQGRATAIGENVGGTGPYTSSIQYNANDLPTTATLNSTHSANQAQQVATYDAESRLTHLTATGPSGVANPLTSAYDYAYQNGTDWTTALTWTVNGVVTSTQITHNALGRITNWSGQIHGPESWQYDGNGNIIANSEFISDAIRTTVFTYDATQPNQLDQQQTMGLGVESYTYDKHGDTTSLVSTDPAFYPSGQVDPYHVNIHVGYDAQERPITVTTLMNGTPITVTLGYNAAGQRDRYTVVSGTTTLRDERFSYRGGDLGQDVVLSGTQTYTDTFIYNQDGLPLELLRQQAGSTSRYWYVLDGRDNVVALVDTTGNVVDRYAYDLWGEGLPEGTVETVRQPLRYRGYWWDSEVGWYWVNIRYYDPEGRWLQPDPGEQDGIYTYVYVSDDPVDLADPSGLGSVSICPAPFAPCFTVQTPDISLPSPQLTCTTPVVGAILQCSKPLTPEEQYRLRLALILGGTHSTGGPLLFLDEEYGAGNFALAWEERVAFSELGMEEWRAQLKQETVNLRAQFPSGRKGLTPGNNVGASALVTDAGMEASFSNSSNNKLRPEDRVPGSAKALAPQEFTATAITTKPGETRVPTNDSEYKMLTAMSHLLKQRFGARARSVSGNLYMYSERMPCESCQGVIQQFRIRYPYIRVHVWWDLDESRRYNPGYVDYRPYSG